MDTGTGDGAGGSGLVWVTCVAAAMDGNVVGVGVTNGGGMGVSGREAGVRGGSSGSTAEITGLVFLSCDSERLS